MGPFSLFGAYLMCPQQAIVTGAGSARETELAVDVDVMLAELIDRHLSHIYPIYWARTRAILMRQARELLLDHFEGCLPSFEQRYLCKFAQIAAKLRATHQIGEVSAPQTQQASSSATPSPAENPTSQIATDCQIECHRSII